MHFQKVTLAGVGLLGGSLGLALRQRQLATHIEGLVRRAASVDECQRLGVVDHATRDPRRAAEGSDLIVLCSPLGQMRALIEAMRPAFKPGVVVTDVGSVKSMVVEQLEPLVAAGGGQFVGSHPMAGAERTGPAAARADLFAGAVCVITPATRTSTIALAHVEWLWKAVGAVPIRMTAEAHDNLVSRSSHLPHVVAAGLVNYVLSPMHPKEQAMVCANGFRDTTRVASGSPAMWRDIVMANRRNLARVLGVFIADLEDLKHALDQGDTRSVEEFLETAKLWRDNWIAPSAATSPE